MTALGVIHGRFQPLHHGHLEYLMAGAERCDVLVVGITNPDPDLVSYEAADPARGTAEANPCSYYERHLMVEGALLDASISYRRFRIVPFPHSFPHRLLYYAPAEATYYLTIYDQWGVQKKARFDAIGLTTEVMWRRTEKPISGSRVRQAIRNGENWQGLVPAAVAAVIQERKIDERIRQTVCNSAVRGRRPPD